MASSPPNSAPSAVPNKASVTEIKGPSQTSTIEEKHEEDTAPMASSIQLQQKTVPMSTRSWRFWSVFLACCLISLLSGIDATVITTALPTITRELGGSEDYIWVANSFVFASTVPQPLFAQTANIFGRRNPMLVALVLFGIGSGIAGGASSPAMLIAGRTVQGLGTGGAYVLLDVICCDLVSLRERGKYLGIMLSTAAIGTSIGPLIGGALAETQWRWIFYLNLPITGLAIVAVALFLKVGYKRSPTWLAALKRVDWIGVAIFVPSILSVFLGLVLGGVQFPWGSWHVIVPLVLGVLGWAAYHYYQTICPEPSMPPLLFTNRTSAAGFVLTFLSSMLLQIIAYFMPVYFQGVLGKSPFQAGVQFLPFTVAVVPFAIVAGVLLSTWGQYKPLHAAGFGLAAVGFGLLSILNADSPQGYWIGFLIVAASGIGLLLSVLLPSILAALPESEVATASGAFSFVRSFGYVWGVTVASVIFDGQFQAYQNNISDTAVRDQLVGGGAYSFASGGFVSGLPTQTRSEVIGVYVQALKVVWEVSIAFAALGVFCVLIEKHIPLRQDLNTEYGLEEKKQDRDVEDNTGALPALQQAVEPR
ncbi:MAG: hypothetical protein GOMPHAMPRED_004262 [Gomphillus americanus]|uniref:Major facilitator superfamily (MFS) profile domain-containing protein n=1 Tax=Gomphillus americanus TaxID=1940652 RepID=A0A8H3FTB0_9LECA|nr:MAG: hypothetical protein GOMPHAMPRED_004262 [Gomphillus americanus]